MVATSEPSLERLRRGGGRWLTEAVPRLDRLTPLLTRPGRETGASAVTLAATSGQPRAVLIWSASSAPRGALELARRPGDAEALLADFGDDVEMHVENRLVGRAAVVLQHVVGGGAGRRQDRPAEPRQDPAEGRRRLVAQLVEVGLALLGDDQGVAGRQRARCRGRRRRARPRRPCRTGCRPPGFCRRWWAGDRSSLAPSYAILTGVLHPLKRPPVGCEGSGIAAKLGRIASV